MRSRKENKIGKIDIQKLLPVNISLIFQRNLTDAGYILPITATMEPMEI